MTRKQPQFNQVDVVQRVNQAEAVGVVREARWDSQVERWTYVGFFISDNDAMPKLREATNKALAIKETLGEPHASAVVSATRVSEDLS